MVLKNVSTRGDRNDAPSGTCTESDSSPVAAGSKTDACSTDKTRDTAKPKFVSNASFASSLKVRARDTMDEVNFSWLAAAPIHASSSLPS